MQELSFIRFHKHHMIRDQKIKKLELKEYRSSQYVFISSSQFSIYGMRTHGSRPIGRNNGSQWKDSGIHMGRRRLNFHKTCQPSSTFAYNNMMMHNMKFEDVSILK